MISAYSLSAISLIVIRLSSISVGPGAGLVSLNRFIETSFFLPSIIHRIVGFKGIEAIMGILQKPK